MEFLKCFQAAFIMFLLVVAMGAGVGFCCLVYQLVEASAKKFRDFLNERKNNDR